MRTFLNHTKKNKRGNNLLEITIVLMIIGMVLAGVWVYASGVRMADNARVVSAQVLTTMHNVRAVFIEQGAVRGTADFLTPALDRLRAFPVEMRQNPTTDSGVIFHVWSNSTTTLSINTNPTVTVGTFYAGATDCTGADPAASTTPEPCFSIYLSNLPAQACIRLAVALTMAGQGIAAVVINGASLSVPVSAAVAGTNCSSTYNALQFVNYLRDNS